MLARACAGKPVVQAATTPIPLLLQSCAALGWIGFDPDDDGTARSIRPAVTYAPQGAASAAEVWSFPFVLAALSGTRVDTLPGRPAAEELLVGGRRASLDEDGRMLLRFHGGEKRTGSTRSPSYSSRRAAP